MFLVASLTHFLRGCVSGVALLLSMSPRFLPTTYLAAHAFCVGATVAAEERTEKADARRSYDLPRGDAATALSQFARISGRQIMFMMDAVQGQRTNAVVGEYSPREALDHMLAGTALSVWQDQVTGAFMISREAIPSQPAPVKPVVVSKHPSNEDRTKSMKRKTITSAVLGWLVLAISSPTDAQTVNRQSSETPGSVPGHNPPTGNAVVQLSPFEVQDTQDNGYRSLFSNSGTLVAEDLRNLPTTIAVLNRDLINDIGAIDIFELSRYAPAGEYNNNPTNDTAFVFRGVSNEWQTRNFFIWYLPTDSFSIERVEILRGPNALLYGDAAPGGLMNVITKRAQHKDFATVRVTAGSWDFYRGEIDVNRRIGEKLAVRVNAVSSHKGSFYDYRYNNFDGGHFAIDFRPFQNTRIRGEFEKGSVDRNTGTVMFVDAFTSYNPAVGGTGGTSARTGTSNFYLSYDGKGVQRYGSSGFRISTGTNRPIDQTSPYFGEFDREWQFVGPSAYSDRRYTQWSLSIEQTLFERLTIEATINQQDQTNTVLNGTTGAVEIRRDPNPLLPNGAANPNYNEFFVDNLFFKRDITNDVMDYRLAATYELDLPFGIKQRLLAIGTRREDDFSGRTWEERASENLGVQVYRRTYLKDYKNRDLSWSLLPGQTEWFGASFWGDTVNMLTSQSYVALGSYWDGRLRSMVGYRRDRWDVDRRARLDVPRNGVVERVGFSPTVTGDPTIKDESVNYGGVFHAVRDFHGVSLSLVGNYSESFRPTGNEIDIFGKPMDPVKAKGEEAGIRLELLQGKLAVTGTVFDINIKNNRGNVSQAVRNEINNMFGNIAESTSLGSAGDTTSRRSKGYEFEASVNLTQNWSLTANYSHVDLSDTDVYPRVRPLWERAQTENRPLTDYPNLNTLLSNAVENSTWVAPERDKIINAFTRYTFTRGPLKNLKIGGGVNYRSPAYLSRIAGQFYFSPSSTFVNGLIGYRLKFAKRAIDLQLNINNLTDKDTYTSYGLNTAQWTAPREYRFSASTKF